MTEKEALMVAIRELAGLLTTDRRPEEIMELQRAKDALVKRLGVLEMPR